VQHLQLVELRYGARQFQKHKVSMLYLLAPCLLGPDSGHASALASPPPRASAPLSDSYPLTINSDIRTAINSYQALPARQAGQPQGGATARLYRLPTDVAAASNASSAEQPSATFWCCL
jgi:hypothetical protein